MAKTTGKYAEGGGGTGSDHGPPQRGTASGPLKGGGGLMPIIPAGRPRFVPIGSQFADDEETDRSQTRNESTRNHRVSK